MKIIDAHWEKRNLGVNTIEVHLEDTDTVKTIEEVSPLTEEAEYVVFKVPVARFDLVSELSKKGYCFAESLINVVVDPKNAVLTPLQQRVNSAISYKELSPDEIETVYKKIKEGIFDTDRIALDPYFSKEQAAQRYVFWIQDEVKKGCQVYEIIYKDKGVGFFTFKENVSGAYFPFLAGLYKDVSAAGIGYSVIRKPIEEALKRGGNKISTYISSNNHTIHVSHIQQGFIPQEVKYIFIKHNK